MTKSAPTLSEITRSVRIRTDKSDDADLKRYCEQLEEISKDYPHLIPRVISVNPIKVTEENVKWLRVRAGNMRGIKMNQTEAAKLLYRNDSSHWRDWERGRYKLHTSLAELFCLKTGIHWPPNFSEDA